MTPDATPPEDALQALPPAVEFTAPPRRPRRGGRAVLFAGVAGACVLGAGLGLWARPGMSERRLALAPPTSTAPVAAAPHGLQVVVDDHPPPVGAPMQVLPVSAATASAPSASPMPLPVFSPPPRQATPAPAPAPAFSRPAIQTASAEAAPSASFSPKLASLITAAMAAPHMLLAKLETPPKAEPAQLAQAEAPSKAERQAQARDEARAKVRAEAQAREDARVQARAQIRNEARAEADRAAAKTAAHRLALAQAAEAQAAQKAARDEAAAERLAEAKAVRQHAADLKLAQAKAQERAAHAKAVEIQLAKAEAALAAKAAAASHAAKLAQAHAQAQALAQAQAKSEKAEAVRLANAEAKGRAEARADARAEALAEAREEARKQIRLASLVRTLRRALPHEARPQPAPVQTARLDRKHAKAAERREAVIERASAHKAARAAPPPSHARAAPAAPLVAPSGLMKVSTRCAQRDPGEALVCADPNLGAADRQLARAYQGARAAGVPDAQLQRQQQRWLAARTAAAREAPWAVHDVYMARIAELNGLAKDAHGDGY